MILNQEQKKWFVKQQLLLYFGYMFGLVKPFDDELYERLSYVTFSCIPASIQIKYLRPTCPPGQCYERSWIITMAFDECYLVRGDLADYKAFFGEEQGGHGWVEHDGWVYDPTTLLKYNKNLYYMLHNPNPRNIIKHTKEEVFKNPDYQKCISGQISKSSLFTILLLIQGIAEKSNDESFINEVAKYLKDLGYDNIWQLQQEVNENFNDLVSGRPVDESRLYAYYQKK